MTTKLQITHSPVGEVTEGQEQPDPAGLSVEEIRNCFPGRTLIVADGGSAIVLEDGPLFGVLVDVSELWERVRQGAMTAEAVDFYGEYKLVMRVREGVVELENEFSGARVSVPQQAFAIAAGVWSESLLKEAEQRHPGLSQNSNYAKLKSFVQTTWAATAHT